MGGTCSICSNAVPVAPLPIHLGESQQSEVAIISQQKILKLRSKRSSSSGKMKDVLFDVSQGINNDCAQYSGHAMDLIELFLTEVYKEHRSVDNFGDIFATPLSRQYFFNFLEEELKGNMDVFNVRTRK
jgi:hypothetical protein